MLFGSCGKDYFHIAAVIILLGMIIYYVGIFVFFVFGFEFDMFEYLSFFLCQFISACVVIIYAFAVFVKLGNKLSAHIKGEPVFSTHFDGKVQFHKTEGFRQSASDVGVCRFENS